MLGLTDTKITRHCAKVLDSMIMRETQSMKNNFIQNANLSKALNAHLFKAFNYDFILLCFESHLTVSLKVSYMSRGIYPSSASAFL